MSDKPAVYWVQDGGGVSSCHVNDGALNFKQSLIATLVWRNAAWRVILADDTDISPEEGYDSLYKARNATEAYYQKNNGKAKVAIATDRMTPRVAQPGTI